LRIVALSADAALPWSFICRMLLHSLNFCNQPEENCKVPSETPTQQQATLLSQPT
ncbi:16757_t:CDS:1, partial [Racocetra persica]